MAAASKVFFLLFSSLSLWRRLLNSNLAWPALEAVCVGRAAGGGGGALLSLSGMALASSSWKFDDREGGEPIGDRT